MLILSDFYSLNQLTKFSYYLCPVKKGTKSHFCIIWLEFLQSTNLSREVAEKMGRPDIKHFLNALRKSSGTPITMEN